MFNPVVHHVVDGQNVVMILVDDVLRRFECRLVAVLEPPVNACVVRVNGAVVLTTKCFVAGFRPKVEIERIVLRLLHPFAQAAYLLLQHGNGRLFVPDIDEVYRVPLARAEIAVNVCNHLLVRISQRMQALDVRTVRQLVGIDLQPAAHLRCSAPHRTVVVRGRRLQLFADSRNVWAGDPPKSDYLQKSVGEI